MTYAEKLLDPRWQKKRLEVLNRDNWTCSLCSDTQTTLHIHHWVYNNEPWDVENEDLVTVCKRCHKILEGLKQIKEDSNLQRVMNFRSDSDPMLLAAIIGSQDGSGMYSVVLYEYYTSDDRLIWLTSMSPKYIKDINGYFDEVRRISNKSEAPS